MEFTLGYALTNIILCLLPGFPPKRVLQFLHSQYITVITQSFGSFPTESKAIKFSSEGKSVPMFQFESWYL